MGRPRGVVTLVLFSVLCLFPNAAKAEDTKSIRVFAAASTISALTRVAAVYSKSNAIKMVPIFASSGALARHIDSGMPGHIFLSANQHWMNWLTKRGRINRPSRRVFLENHLVIAVLRKSTLKLSLVGGDFIRALGMGRLAMADPDHVPLGTYGRAALKKLGVWNGVKDRVLRLSDAARTREIVERGEAVAGILYASDIKGNPKLRAAVRFDTHDHPPIHYEIALLQRAANNAAALRFLKWLKGAAAKQIFTNAGFQVK